MEIRKVRIEYKDGTYSEPIPITTHSDEVKMIGKDKNLTQNINEIESSINILEEENSNQQQEINGLRNIFNKKPYCFDNIREMKNTDFLKNGDIAITLGYYRTDDGGSGKYKIRTKTEEDIEDNGSIHFLSNNLIAELIVKNNINYNQFGAYGDGIHNDSDSLYKTHIFANKNNYTVEANNKSIYFISSIKASIPIKTNVNWNKAKFLIDDSNISIQDGKKFIFEIASNNNFIDVTSKLAGKKIKKGQEYIKELEGNSNCYLKISNSNKKIYIRRGVNENQGIDLFDVTRIDNQGKIIDEIIWDFDTITKAEIRKIDESELKINGGNFTTIVNKVDSYNYYNRGIKISRDNVTLENLEHYLEGEDTLTSSPYNGFIVINNTVNVTLKNCILTAHKFWKNASNVSKGSYDFGTTEDINIKIINCKQSNSITTEDFWSVFSGYNSKNLFLENVEFNRFGSHMGFWNFTIKNSIIGCRAMGFCGGGVGNFENVKVLNSKEFIEMKDDYGSAFDGVFNIKNCSISYETKNGTTDWNTPVIIKAINNGKYDYGIIPYLPKVNIEGFNFLYGGEGTQFCSVFEISAPIEGVDYNKDYFENAKAGYFPQMFFPEIKCKDIHINNKEKQRFVLFQSQDLWKAYCKDSGKALNYFNAAPWGAEVYGDWKNNIECNCKITLDNCDFVNFYTDFNRSRCSLYGTGDLDIGEIVNTHNFVPEINIKNINEPLLFGLGHRAGLFNIENSVIQTITTASGDSKTYCYFNIKDCIFLYKYYNNAYPAESYLANFSPAWNQIRLERVTFKKDNNDTTLSDIAKEFPFYTMTINTTSNNFLRIAGEVINCKAWDTFKEEAENVSMMSSANRKIFGFKLEDLFNRTNRLSYPRKYGTTSQRPTENDLYQLDVGHIYYDTSLKKSIIWIGTEWKNIDGTNL